jgi:hypothetical protein
MNALIPNNDTQLFFEIQKMIRESQVAVRKAVNSKLVMLYWNIGKRINDEILKHERHGEPPGLLLRFRDEPRHHEHLVHQRDGDEVARARQCGDWDEPGGAGE